MPAARLPWRIALPFAAFMLVGSVLLLVLLWWNVRADERRDFETLARTNAAFLTRMALPSSERMALQLQEVLGVGVHFRHRDAGLLIPPPPSPEQQRQLATELPPDGVCHQVGSLDAVAFPLDDLRDLVLTRPLSALPSGLTQGRTFAVLGAFWLLALGFGWLISRGLVLPLRHLAARLPDIEAPGPLALPEAAREDEIGDVARAFVRTREALHRERTRREQAEKLAVLGRMTAALAHEIQNPVSAIKLHAQLLPDDGPDMGTARVIETEATRIEELVSQWMFLSKPQPPAVSEVDAAQVLAEVLRVQQPQCEHAQVRTRLEAPPGLTVPGDARRLSQVFRNLVVNAIQAMPLGGLLEVRASKLEEERVVVITFTDSGRGFSPEALARFSEFFYSEKEGGMGIGLSVAGEIVKGHGGSLTVANRPEGGAVVTVTLPAAQL